MTPSAMQTSGPDPAGPEDDTVENRRRQAPAGSSQPPADCSVPALRKLAAELSRQLTEVQTDQVGTVIEEALRQIADTIGVQQCVVYKRTPGDVFTVAFVHREPGIAPGPETAAPENMPWALKQLLDGQALDLPRLPQDLPAEAAGVRRLLEELPFRAIVAVPMRFEGRVCGHIACRGTKARKAWSAELVEVLQGIGEQLANAMHRQTALEEYRSSEQRYQAVFEHAGDAMLVLWKGHVVDCNRRAAAMFAATRSQLIGADPARLSPSRQPDGSDSLVRARDYMTRASAGKDQVFEWRHRRFDGTPFDAEVNLSRIDSNGQIQLLAAVRDVSERKRMEQRLADSQTWQQLLLDNLPMTFYIADAHGTFDGTWTGEQIGRLTGFPQSRFLEERGFWQERLHPDDRERILQQFDMLLEQGTLGVEYRWRVADGTYRWFLDQAVLVEGPDGEPERIVGAWFDITERVRTADALERSEQRFRQLVERGSDVISIVDPDGRLLYISPSVHRVLGYAVDELVGGTTLDLVHPEDLDKVRQAFQEGSDNPGTSRTVEYRFRHRDGTWRVLESVVHTPATNQPGEPEEQRHSIVNSRDVTERIEAALERRRLEQQVRQTQKLEAIGTLAGGIAHDFNNILQAIIGYTQLAQESAPPRSRQEQYLTHVIDAARRATDLVAQILTFSRTQEQSEQLVYVAALAKEAIKLLRPSIPATVSIQQRIDNRCPPVLADATQVHQLIVNLGTNAYQAMERSGGVLTLELQAVTLTAEQAAAYVDLKPGAYVQLVVSDTGCGMTPDVQERAFEPFFTTKEIGEGTGMGLATVHGIVHALGGTVTVDSAPGEGTSVTVLLPAQPTARDHAAPTTADPDKRLPVGRERVLFVDDERNLAAIALEGLERLGYCVTACTSPVQALDLFARQPDDYDIVVTDYAMPYLNGVELAAKLHGIRPRCPIILSSGFAEDVTAADELDITEFLLKPATPRGIARAIRRAFDGAEAWPESR